VIISDVYIKGFWGRNEVKINLFKNVTLDLLGNKNKAQRELHSFYPFLNRI
jgi:hypothetical protein